MSVLQSAALLMLAVAAFGVVRTREPGEQTISLGFFGLVLALTFFLFQAPDVALAQVVIGPVVLPLMVMLTLAHARRSERRWKREEERS